MIGVKKQLGRWNFVGLFLTVFIYKPLAKVLITIFLWETVSKASDFFLKNLVTDFQGKSLLKLYIFFFYFLPNRSKEI
jgi:hypothetical protein